MYGEHPYGMNVLGRDDTVRSFSREDLLTYYRNTLVPSNAVISVVGDVDVESVMKDLSSRFALWEGKMPAFREKRVVPVPKNSEVRLEMEKEQSLVLVGYQSVRMDDDMKYPLSIVGSLLSGSGGMLFNAAREGEGMTYASGARSSPELDKGYFVLYIATSEEFVEKAVDIIDDVTGKVALGEIDEEDIRASKNRLISGHALALQRNSGLAMSMSLNELYGLGYDNYRKYPERIMKVTEKEVIDAASKVFSDGNPAVLIIRGRTASGR
jgi:zinc protease